MANIKISELNELETKNGEDLLAIVDTNNNETKKIKVETLAPENFELKLISDTEPTGLTQGDCYYNTTTNKIYRYVGGGVYLDLGEPKTGILYIIYSSQTIYTYNGTTLINVGGSGNYSELDGKPSINGNTLNGNKTNAELGIPNVLNGYSTSTTDGYSCNYVNTTFQQKGELIWSNPNSSNAFDSQIINFNDTYSYYDIIMIQDGLVIKCQRCYVDANINTILENNLGGYIRTREIRAYNNSIAFAGGNIYTTYTSATANDYQCIPYQIIGYK